ncbi:putative 3-oxoacyl-(acyl-carrier-protein) synthase (Polyketide synthase) [Vibrio nigripulchritudo SFn27]|uniref:Putative 3-oxoacyl-(Acyl-carrier-protein) synthase (Polyketide synthase) n=1 Tax=Vibrio nigripulchritudo TaxID=28173 RepID=U4K413_9VIBR|nr:beta-ketoacyl-[acyl-carrier-protein] synthase family protein [Vibrio nigripulchritudo]CCN83625.1 putative 3-oxoacyl-(acyl-carrier-protein) synthase (Polyketide synthase) [Vibrio nigripulchritudo BLFn1]CCN87369.1 putative 3-oxoacyl-(acyl-carrier-protein) synthase (Polyketide synthase) [Vibrio nigripulchritudo SFn27]CCN94748.1 putative 3-oxoacyl-(acyl-carrier-protein) synthase (Polyketide synthase) [Vibrio nigripulchritudo ENn2]CCO40711.1 putative 3-oxoacyl-(acyl-carrier-protein) synthase (Pol
MIPSDVVITGMGLFTSLGTCVPDVWNQVLLNRSGIKDIPRSSWLSGHGVHLLASAPSSSDFSSFTTKWNVSRKTVRNMGRASNMFCYSTLSALEHAGFHSPSSLPEHRSGIIVGTGTSLCDEYHSTALSERNPTWFLDTYPNIVLGQASLVTGITGFGSTIVNACTSASLAIGQAYRMIQSGEADVMVAGGSDSRLSPSFLSGFSQLSMHTNSDDAERAMRPFDKLRSGFVLGEGAGALVLERKDHAIQRGAKILARVAGFASSMDAFRMTDPCPVGKLKAMRRALSDAQLQPSQIDYVNAHGTSTLANDREEAKATADVFGTSRPLVNSSKYMIGHTLAASGAIESILCIQSLLTQTVHGNPNLDQPDPACTLNFVGKEAEKHALRYCMNNSSGIGGTNTSLIFERELVEP